MFTENLTFTQIWQPPYFSSREKTKSDGCLIFEGIGEENRFLGLKVVFL